MLTKAIQGCHGRQSINRQNEQVVSLRDLAPQPNIRNEDHTIHGIHEILETYYKVARKRVVLNICKQAVDYHLVTGPTAPMELISATWVNDLSDHKLEEVSGEDMGSKRRRRQLQKEIHDLEEGKKFLLT